MTKYVKLKADRSALDSAVYSVQPRQLRSINRSDYSTYNWFEVEEHYEFRSDRELYRYVNDRWELADDGKVHMYYVPEIVPLDMRRVIMSKRCNEIRNQKLSEGLLFRGKRFDTRPETYTRLTGAVLKALRDTEFQTGWITQDNSQVLLTNADILALGDAYADFESKFIMFSRGLKDQVEASVTPEEFDVYAGWPSIEYEIDVPLTILVDGSPSEE